MAYINLATLEYPRYVGDLAIDPHGTYALVAEVPEPDHDRATQDVFERAPLQLADGTWQMQWEIVDLTPEQIEANKSPAERMAEENSKPGGPPDVL